MMVLNRRWGERIVIRSPDGQEVWVTVLPEPKNRRRAKLGIDAPRAWSVDREEVDLARRGLASTSAAAGQAAGQGGSAETTLAGDEVAPTVGDAPGEPGLSAAGAS